MELLGYLWYVEPSQLQESSSNGGSISSLSKSGVTFQLNQFLNGSSKVLKIPGRDGIDTSACILIIQIFSKETLIGHSRKCTYLYTCHGINYQVNGAEAAAMENKTYYRYYGHVRRDSYSENHRQDVYGRRSDIGLENIIK